MGPSGYAFMERNVWHLIFKKESMVTTVKFNG